VVDNGTPTLVYHGVPGGTCLATSDDPDLIRWTKHPANPVIPVPNHGRYKVYDPFAWRHGDVWYALSGNAIENEGDVAYLFRSSNLVDWEYVHPFYKSERRWTDAGEDCAVPSFFPFGDRHMLLFVSHKCGMQYYLGRLEGERFIPEQHARMNWAGGPLIAPMTLLDAAGRRIMLGWICEARRTESCREAGWAGVLTLPRVLSPAQDGSLRITPARELEMLRRNERPREVVPVAAGDEVTLDGIMGDSLEIAVTVAQPSAVGVKVRCSPDGAEATVVSYRPSDGVLSIDTTRSSEATDIVQPWPCPWGVMYPDPFETRVLPYHTEPVEIFDVRIQEAPLELGPGEPLTLRIFLDRSVLEVFANDRQCITQRIYPSRPDSLGVRLCALGGDPVGASVTAWDMAPAIN
jgi:sucrose-6-phosphate hydrolase SacC (GH32 family)